MSKAVAQAGNDPTGSGQIFRDGLGERQVVVDPDTSEICERLRLAADLGGQHAAVKERVTRLLNFRNVRFPRLHQVIHETSGHAKSVTVVSDHVPGIRLLVLLEAVDAHATAFFDVNASLQVAREVLPALSVLHDSRGVTHGAVGLERLILTPQGRVVLADYALGAALTALQFPRSRLWKEFRVAMPPSASVPRFDVRADVANLALTLLSLLRGRALTVAEFPAGLQGLLQDTTERFPNGSARELSGSLLAWFERALPLESRRPFGTASEAHLALEDVLKKEPGYAPSSSALRAIVERCGALRAHAPGTAGESTAGQAAAAPTAAGRAKAVPVEGPARRGRGSAAKPRVRRLTPEEEQAEEIKALEIELARLAALEAASAAQREAAAPTVDEPPQPTLTSAPDSALVAASHAIVHSDPAAIAPEAEEVILLEADLLFVDLTEGPLTSSVANAAAAPFARETIEAEIVSVGEVMPVLDVAALAGETVSTIVSHGGDLRPPDQDDEELRDLERLLAELQAVDAGRSEAQPNPDIARGTEVSHSETDQPGIDEQVGPFWSLTAFTVDAAPDHQLDVEGGAGSDAVVRCPDTMALNFDVPGYVQDLIAAGAATAGLIAEPSRVARHDVIRLQMFAASAPARTLPIHRARASRATQQAGRFQALPERTSTAAAPLAIVRRDAIATAVQTAVQAAAASQSPLSIVRLAEPSTQLSWRRAGDAVLPEAAPGGLEARAAAAWPLDADLGSESAAALQVEAFEDVVADVATDVEPVASLSLPDHEPPLPAVVPSGSQALTRARDAGTPKLPPSVEAELERLLTKFGTDGSGWGPQRSQWGGASALPTAEPVAAAAASLEPEAPPEAVAEIVATAALRELSPSSDVSVADASSRWGRASALPTAEPVAAAASVEPEAPPEAVAEVVATAALRELSPSSDVSVADASPRWGRASALPTAEPVAAAAASLEPEAPQEALAEVVAPAQLPESAPPSEVSVADGSSRWGRASALPTAEPSPETMAAEAAVDDLERTIRKPNRRRSSKRSSRKAQPPAVAPPPLVAGRPSSAPTPGVAIHAASPQPLAGTPVTPAALSREVGVIPVAARTLDEAPIRYEPWRAIPRGGVANPQAVTARQPEPTPAAPPSVDPWNSDVEAGRQSNVVPFRTEARDAGGVAQAFRPADLPVDRPESPLWDTHAELHLQGEVQAPRSKSSPVAESDDSIAPGASAGDTFGHRPLRTPWKRAAAAAIAATLLGGVASATVYWIAKPSEMGTLLVQTSQPGVEVRIDGRANGRTPLTAKLTPGRHTLELRGFGTTKVVPVEISAGVQTTQAVTWPNATRVGRLVVTTTPPGARILVDGVDKGTSPVTLDGVRVGLHTVVAESSNGTVSSQVRVTANGVAEAQLGIFSGWLTVFAPVEVRVFESGKLLGTSLDGKMLIPAGPHTLEFVNKALGYRDRRAVDIEPGKETTLSIEPPSGSIVIEAPDGTEIIVDGQPAGVTPVDAVSAPIGTRDVILRHPGLGQRRMTVTVGADVPARVSMLAPQ